MVSDETALFFSFQLHSNILKWLEFLSYKHIRGGGSDFNWEKVKTELF